MCVLHVKLRTNKMKCNTYVCTHIFFTKVLKPALATVTTATVPTVSDALHTKWHMHQSSLFEQRNMDRIYYYNLRSVDIISRNLDL